MTDTNTTLTRFNRVTEIVRGLNFKEPTQAQVEAMFTHLGKDAFNGLFGRVVEGQPSAKQLLEDLLTATRLCWTLLELGASQSSLGIAQDLIGTHTLEKLRKLVSAAHQGNASARSTILNMVQAQVQAAEQAASGVDPLAQAFPGTTTNHDPIHPTPLQPPGSNVVSMSPAHTTNSGAVPARVPARNPAQAQSVDADQVVDAEVDPSFTRQSRQEVLAASQERPAASADKKYDQVGVFGRDRVGATALQFDCSPAKWDPSITTINISLARARGKRTQDGVDWANKITLMLTDGEVPVLHGALLGYVSGCRFAGHGSGNNKWMSVSESTGDYAGSIMVTVAEGADQRACSIGPADLAQVIAIVDRAFVSQTQAAPTPAHVISKRVAVMYDFVRQREQSKRANTGGGQRAAG